MQTDMFARLAVVALVAPCAARHAVPEFKIDLDLPPESRFIALVPHFNTTVWSFYNKYFANDAVLRDALYALADVRRPHEPAELMAEVEGLAAASKLPAKFVHGVQFLYEIQTLMVPIVNFTSSPLDLSASRDGNNTMRDAMRDPPFPRGWEGLARIPWRGPGCTGIVASDNGRSDGVVYHARNLDFAPESLMKDLVYTAIFTRNGTELFRSQMVAGYMQVVTAMRRGKDGYVFERNTRYTDHVGGNLAMLGHLLGGRTLNAWSVRKILETHADYDSAVAAIAAVPYVSTEYAIVSGVRKGVILAKDPDKVAHVQTLGQHNAGQRDDYILITNFDFFWKDVREYFDPTGWSFSWPPVLTPRRVNAQVVLNASQRISPQLLFDAINTRGVIADTIFQGVFSVEMDLWNVSIPDH